MYIIYIYVYLYIYIYIYIYIYSQCQNYRTEPGVQKYGKIPYLRTPPDPDSARIRIRSIIEFPVSKSKCTKHTIVGPLLEVEMSKKCTPLWREAHFEVKMHKTLGVRTTFGRCDVEKVHAVVAQSTFGSKKC